MASGHKDPTLDKKKIFFRKKKNFFWKIFFFWKKFFYTVKFTVFCEKSQKKIFFRKKNFFFSKFFFFHQNTQNLSLPSLTTPKLSKKNFSNT